MSARADVIKDWINETDKALEALRNWRAHLGAWQLYAATLPDDYFMSCVRDIAEAGLIDWLSTNPAGLDKLRRTITTPGGAADESTD